MKKISLLLLTMVLALTLFAMPVSAGTYENYLTYEIYFDEVYITDCDTLTAGAITLPSQIKGKPVVCIDNRAFQDCTALTSVTIPEGVTEICYDAFENCTALTTISIPQSVTEIGETAFKGTPWLNAKRGERADKLAIVNGILIDGLTASGAITIPETVNALVDYAFYKNTAITSVNILGKVQEIPGNAFSGCKNLAAVNLPAGLKEIGFNAFGYCEALTSITLPEGLTTLGMHAFSCCSNLKTINIPGSVTEFGYRAFYQTPWLTAKQSELGSCLVIVNRIVVDGKAASGKVKIPDNVEAIAEYAFSGNKNITEVTLQENVKKIGEEAFADCTALTAVTIKSEIESVGINAFSKTPWLTAKKSDRPDGLVIVNDKLLLDGKECTGAVVIPEGVTTIAQGAFEQCAGITSVSIPGSLKNIDCFAFNECEALKTVTFGEGVESIREMAFCNCNLDSVNFPDSLKTVEMIAFGNCLNLNHVYAGKNLDTMEHFAFMGCAENLKIYGYPGSTLETFAKDENIGFVAYGTPFTDVKPADYFAKPVTWAVVNKITNGTNKEQTLFSPGETCTRGQVVTFLYRAAGEPAVKNTLNPFNDVKTTDYFYNAVLWAVEQGITTGTSSNTFSPSDSCTRWQVVTFLWRNDNKPEPQNAANPFTDVASSDTAVLWAVEQGITNGTSATSFSPTATCTRGQIVTFLFRYFN